MKHLISLALLCILTQFAWGQTFFYYEDFSSGNDTIMPTGWVTNSNVGNWKCTQAGSTTVNALAPLNSISSTNNWMIFDSELIDLMYPMTAQVATLTSPSINCSTQSVVQLFFEEYYRKTSDLCFVDVSNDGGSTWTSFSVFPNSDLPMYNFTANAEHVVLNISSVAANQSNVKIRFRYSAPIGGGISWSIDDVFLGESLWPADLNLDYSFLTIYDPIIAMHNTFSTIPTQLCSTTSNGTYASNLSSVDIQSYLVKRNLYNATNTLLSSQSNFSTNLASGIYNQYVHFPSNSLPTTLGNYLVEYSAFLSNDIDSTNNKDTVRFNIHPSEYAQDNDSSIATYYLYRPDNPFTSVDEFARWKAGCLYTIPTGKSDTLTDIHVAFGLQTKPGSSLVAHIYYYDGITYSLQYSSDTITLTTANIPTSIANVFTVFPFSNYPITAPPILFEGTYVAVVEPVSVTGFDTITLRHSELQFSGITVGLFDASAVPATFGQSGISSVSYAPMIRLNFAPYNSGYCTPSLTISVSNDTICEGTNIVFSSYESNGGSSPIYQWYLNGNPIIGATNDTYTTNSILYIDTVHCMMTSNATCLGTATSTISNSISVWVNPAPGLLSSVLTPVFTNCELDPIPLYATLTPGLAGTIQWYDQNGINYVNGTNILFPLGTYTFTAIATVGNCLDTFISFVNIPPQPSFTVTVNPSTTICAGDSITISAMGNASFMVTPSIIFGQAFVMNATDSFSVWATDSIGCASNQIHTIYIDSNLSYSVQIASNKPDGATGDTIVFTANIQPSSLTQYNLSWYLNGVYQTTNTNPTNTFQHILTSANDSVYAVLMPTDGCFAPDSLISNVEVIKNVTGLNDFIQGLDVKIYPNPVSDNLTIENLHFGDEINIIDLSGRLISQMKHTNHSAIDISMLSYASGIYLVQITRNEIRYTLKVVKD